MLSTDKFGDQTAKELFANYKVMDLPSYIEYCVGLIKNNMISNKQKKDTFIRAIRECRTKDRVVMKMTSMFLAGEGLAVNAY